MAREHKSLEISIAGFNPDKEQFGIQLNLKTEFLFANYQAIKGLQDTYLQSNIFVPSCMWRDHSSACTIVFVMCFSVRDGECFYFDEN